MLEQKSEYKKVIFLDTPAEHKEKVISILDKVLGKKGRGRGDEFLGTTDQVEWRRKTKTHIVPLSEYLTPLKFVHKYGRTKDQKIDINGKSIYLLPVMKSLTDDEFKVMLGIWNDYRQSKKRTHTQENSNKERLKMLEIMETPAFLNSVLVADILL